MECAKVRDVAPDSLRIEDPGKLLKWLAKDRASMVFKDMKDFETKRSAFQEIIRSWITHV
jgi:hypothetical protein